MADNANTTSGAQQEKMPMQEKVDEYKATHRDPLPELDLALLIKSMDKLNGSCPIKIARNAVDEQRNWIPGTLTSNVGKVYLDDKHNVVFKLRQDGGSMTIDELRDELDPILKRLPLKNADLMVELGEDKKVKLTELFSHSLVKDMWAGLPFDFVMGYHMTAKKRVVAKTEESAE